MYRLLKAAVFLTLLIAGAPAADAQQLTVLDVDPSRFPEMRARFVATNADGSLAEPKWSDLALVDNGTTISDPVVSCAPLALPVPLSSVLVFDVSGSMDGNRLEIARAGARAWIGALSPGRSECAIGSFDDRNYLDQDFTTDKTLLYRAIDNLRAKEGTSYDHGLLLPPAGGLQITARGRHRRVIIFLTDGLSRSETRTADIIAEARRQNCVIYPVTLELVCPPSLREIARQTGGEFFEQVRSVEAIERIYRMLALREQNASPCEIRWTSSDLCSDGLRTVRLGWKGSVSEAVYQVDSAALGTITLSPSSVFITPGAIGVPVDTTITIRARLGARVRSITGSNPLFSITPSSFRLEPGESIDLVVRYTPADSSLQWSRFTIAGDGCSASFDASAGYPRSRPSERTLQVVAPNGGETFIAGTDTLITWNGIPARDRVRIEYSTDDGATWITIADRAGGGSYRWRVPATASPICRVRVSQLSSSDKEEWVRTIGSPGSEIARSVVVDENGYSYVCGSFYETLRIGSTTLVSAGFNDIFIARYAPDGTPLWAVRGGGRGLDAGNGIALDERGNIVVSGVCAGNARVGDLHTPDTFLVYTFVAKMSAEDGSFLWSRAIGGASGSEGGSLDVDDSGNICVGGTFEHPGREFGSTILTPFGNTDAFLAKLDGDGSVLWARQFGGVVDEGPDRGTKARFDRDGNIYVAGQFAATTRFGDRTLTSKGASDMFVARYSPEGELVWVHQGGGPFRDIARAIAVDSIGNVYVGGLVTGPATFDRIAIPESPGLQMFLARYRSDGRVDWVVPMATDFPKADPRSIFLGHSVQGLAVDFRGNIHICASFASTASLAGITLRSRGQQNIAVAQFRPDGSIVWARRAGSPWLDSGSDIAVAPDGALFVAGAFSGVDGPGDFGNDTVAAVGDRDGFLWKIDYGILQSDSSDATFAIVVPEAVAGDVDMGRVIVGEIHDSLVTAYIRNSGGVPFLLQQVLFEGPNAGVFAVVSGAPATIAPGMSAPVEFRFAPAAVGVVDATILLIGGGDTLRHTIRGEGIAPSIGVLSELIDFGQVFVGSSRDSLRAVTITNSGSAPLTISSIRHEGPNAVDFSTLSGTGPITLAPGDTLRIDLRFAPGAVGRTSGRISFAFDGAGSPASLLLHGEGITTTPASAALATASISARAGEEIELPILMRDAVNLEHSGATSIAGRLRFNASLLYPIGQTPEGSIVDGERIIDFELPLPAESESMLGRLLFVALLGNDSTTAITFENAVSIGGPIALTSASGEFRLLDLCYAGGARLFNPEGRTAIVKARVDRGGSTGEVEIETIESGRIRVALVDLLGREVMVLSDGERAAGRHRVEMAGERLSSGGYFVVLTTPTVRRVAMVVVR